MVVAFDFNSAAILQNATIKSATFVEHATLDNVTQFQISIEFVIRFIDDRSWN